MGLAVVKCEHCQASVEGDTCLYCEKPKPRSAVFASGAKSSFEMPRYDLLYRPFLKRVADRMAYGEQKHGGANYQKGGGDAAFRRDRVNHLIEHALKLAEGDTSRDHLAAITANCQIIAWLDDHA